MIRTANGSGRRILSFPAVHPCESISLLTLLDSLIHLAGGILGFKSKPVSTNKRNVRETFRQIHNLLVFFGEIRIRVGSSDRPLPGSAVVSLSELHVIFQKFKYLLEDCTRDGGRLWMLMNSDQVAGHFRVLTRSISTSLDNFPIGSMDLPSEVNELIDLLVRQARKATVGPDPDDKRVVNSVFRIISEFENSVIPDPNEITRVLNHVGIHKWSDCSEEIKYLEEEIATERLDATAEEKKKKTQIELLSGLAGLMCYCRCVIFRYIDALNNKNSDDNSDIGDGDLVRGLNSDDLRCPISLEIMTDPVILSTGHTYDRSSILEWFRSGNLTCPKTGKSLINAELVDNLAVKQVIQQYCSQNGVISRETDPKKKKKNRDVRRTAEPESLAAEGAAKLLAGFLACELVNGGAEEMNRAVHEVRVLTKTSIFNRSCLVEAGVVDPLLKLLRSEDPKTQENAMAALLNLSKHIAGKSGIVENGGLGIIVKVLNRGTKPEARQQAAAVLFYLASVGNYSRLIGENPNAIPGLLSMLKGGNSNDFAKRNALIAIMGLLMQPDNHWHVLAAGAIPVLLDLIKSEETSELTAESTAILAKLAEYPDGTISVIRRGGLKLAVKILGSPEVSLSAKQHCVGLLLNLCVNGGSDVVGALVKSPLLMGSLYTVLSNGGCGGSKKASALIRMIHEFQERKTGSSGSVEPVLPRDRFVHAW